MTEIKYDLKVEDSKPLQLKIEDLKIFEPSKPIDVSKHEGKRIKIEKLKVIDSFSSYEEGKYVDNKYIPGQFIQGLKRPVKKLLVSSEVLEIIEIVDREPIELRASMLFPLKRKFVNGDEMWGASSHPSAKLTQFLKKQKVNSFLDLAGTFVIVTTHHSNDPDDEREYLGFAI